MLLQHQIIIIRTNKVLKIEHFPDIHNLIYIHVIFDVTATRIVIMIIIKVINVKIKRCRL